MDHVWTIVLPFVLILARVTAFMSAGPITGSASVPNIVKVGIALWLSMFFAIVSWPALPAGSIHWLAGSILVVQEVVVGLALGLAARFVFLAIQQGGTMIAQQMGLSDAGIIDPTTGEETDAVSTFMEMALSVVFLAAGGLQLLVGMLARTYKAFPVAALPDTGNLARGLVLAGSAMLVIALKLAAPMIAAFLILAVILAIVARALPEMNILFDSYPLRVGLGLFLTAAMMPAMNTVTQELMQLMNRFIPV